MVFIDIFLYIFTGLDYIALIIFLILIAKQKKRTYFTYYKYQTLLFSFFYFFTKLPLFYGDNWLCKNMTIYRNIFFILLLSNYQFSLIFTYIGIQCNTLEENYPMFFKSSLFISSWLPGIIGLIIAYLTMDDIETIDEFQLCIYEGLLVLYRTVLYTLFLICYFVLLWLLLKELKKYLDYSSSDKEKFNNYIKELKLVIHGGFVVMGNFLIYIFVEIIAHIVGQDKEIMIIIRRTIIIIIEGLIPLIICFYGCLNSLQVSYFFKILKCQKITKSEKSEESSITLEPSVEQEDNEKEIEGDNSMLID